MRVGLVEEVVHDGLVGHIWRIMLKKLDTSSVHVFRLEVYSKINYTKSRREQLRFARKFDTDDTPSFGRNDKDEITARDEILTFISLN